MFVRPKFEIVRDPQTRQPLPTEGAEVPEDSFWLTRLAHGDVALAKPPEAAPEANEAHADVQLDHDAAPHDEAEHDEPAHTGDQP